MKYWQRRKQASKCPTVQNPFPCIPSTGSDADEGTLHPVDMV